MVSLTLSPNSAINKTRQRQVDTKNSIRPARAAYSMAGKMETARSRSRCSLLLPPLLLLLLLQSAWLPSAAGATTLAGRQAAARLLANASIAGVISGIQSGAFTCEDLISEQLQRIDAYNASLAAFISVNREAALAAARAKDRQGGLSGPLHCVPVAVKDNTDLQGVPTTSGALALRSMTAVSDSAVVARLKAAGGIVIGKSNMAEMADSGTKSASTLGGVCANPWDKRRSCLGSSGGSGAAVAAGLAVLGVGTDTEGSVIGPCTASGLVGIRPTQSATFEAMREGVYPAFLRQDLVGLMARDRLDYLTAHDAVFGTNFSTTVSGVTRLDGLTIRFLDNFYDSFPIAPGLNYSPDSEMVRLHNQTAARLAGLGANVERYRTNSTDLGAKLGAILTATATKSACSNSCMKSSLDAYLSRYASTGPFRSAKDLLSVISGFPLSYQQKLNFTLSQPDASVCGSAACDPYNNGRAAVTAIMQELLGSASALAVPFSAKLPQLNTEEPPLPDQISPALNPYTGWPSLAMPVGFSASTGADQPQGMPVSVVLLTREHQERLLLTIANAYLARHAEKRTPSSTPELEVKSAGQSCGPPAIVLLAAAAAFLAYDRLAAV